MVLCSGYSVLSAAFPRRLWADSTRGFFLFPRLLFFFCVFLFFFWLLWGENYYPIDSRRVGWLYLPPDSPTVSADSSFLFFNRPASSLLNFRPISLKEDNLSTHNYTTNQRRKLLVISLSYNQLGLILPTTNNHRLSPY